MALSASEDLNLFRFVDHPAAALELLKAALPAEAEDRTPAFTDFRDIAALRRLRSFSIE